MKKQNLVNLLAKCEQNSEVQIYSNYFFNKNTNTFHFVKYGFYKVTKTDIVIAFNYLENTQIAYIYSEKFEQEIIDFAKRFNNKIILVDGKETFLILKNKNLLPTFDFEEVFNKKQKPAFLKEILKKKNAKRFFLFGVMFIAFSFFVPIKIYYLLCGSIMIAFALFNKLFGKDKKHD